MKSHYIPWLFLFQVLRGSSGWILLGGKINTRNLSSSFLGPFLFRRSTLFLHSKRSSSSIKIPSKTLPPLVVLIPAYNEEERISSTLESYQNFLLEKESSSLFYNCSIVVVDDGSHDSTYDVVNDFLAKIPIHCVKMEQNGGKGRALEIGVEYISEKCCDDINQLMILTQDADGSGNLIYLDSMAHKLANLLCCNDASKIAKQTPGDVDWSTPGLVIGNRNYDLFTPRGITRWGFQTVVRLVMNNLRVQDSQCGYKLMTLAAAKVLYKNLHLKGWSHDVEVLYRAKLLDMPIEEMNIDWEDKDGSKVVASGIIKVSSQMLWDVLRLRWNYSITNTWSLDANA